MKRIRYVSIFLILCILLQCIPAFATESKITLSTAQLDGYNKFTPEENLFSIDGVPGKEFIVLDTDEDAVLLIANEIYSSHMFDGDGMQKFDPEKENNVAYYLNNTLINDAEVFPQEFIPYIDYERVWKTEGGSDESSCPESYDTVCGVSLLSYTEFMKYYKKIGLQDDSVRTDWLLRSPLANTASSVVTAGGTYKNEGKLVKFDANIELGIRPVFWVKNEFFANVKINIAKLGSAAAEEIRNQCSAQTLQNGKAAYNDFELKRMGYNIKGVPDEYVNITFPGEPMYAQNQKDAYFGIEISHNGKENLEYVVEYSKDGSFNDTVRKKYTVKPKKGISEKISLSTVDKGKYNNFTVRISNEYGMLTEKSCSVTIMEFVHKEPLSEYSRIGINWHIDYNTTSYLSGSDKDVENYNKLMNLMGITKTRSIHRWAWNEDQTKGWRNNGRHSFTDGFMVKYGQTFHPYILGMNNTLYFDEDPRTYQNVMDLVEYCTDITDYLKKQGVTIDSFELWNEPNLYSFWRSNRSITYYQMANRLGFEMSKLYPDTQLFGCALASTTNEYPQKFYNRGGLMYVGGFSSHPYSHPTSPDDTNTTRNHINKTKTMLELRNLVGGWLEVAQTEVGYTTATNSSGIDRIKQAEYIPKLYIYNDEMDMCLTDLYTFEDTGWNYDDTEHNWGIVGADLIPKEAVVTLSQLNKYCANTNYLGRFKISDTGYVYVYQKLDELFAIMWSASEDETFEYILNNGETAEDMYGNPIEADNGKIVVDKNLVYLNGIPEEYVAKAISDGTAERIDGLKEKFGQYDYINSEMLSELSQSITAETCKTASGLKRNIDAIYSYGDTLINRYAQSVGDIEVKNITAVLSELYFASKRLVYGYTYFGGGSQNSDKKLENAKNKIAEKKGDEPGSALLYTDAMMRFAQASNKKANDIRANYSIDDAGIKEAIYAADMLAYYLLDWIDKFADLEVPDVSKAIFTYLDETNVTVYKEQSFEFGMEIENLSKHDINGTVVWKNEKEEVLGEATMCSIKSGDCSNVTFSGTIPKNEISGSYTYYVDIFENDKLIKRSYMDVEVKDILEAELADSEVVLGDIEEVAVNVTSIFNAKVMGTVKIEAPEGWVLEKNEKRFVLEPGESQKVAFKIINAKQVPYNEYEFKYSITDSVGDLLVSDTKMLDFTIATRTNSPINVEDFDGNISDWSDAYPIHINEPENATQQQSWNDSNIAVRSMMKWDDNYYYVLTDVYDDLYLQGYTAGLMWQGDSIQLAFDTLNDKTEKYSSDDWEYGVGYTMNGTEVYAYNAAMGSATGSKPEQWAKIIRDKENHITRYLVKIPASSLQPLEFKEGTRFGYDLCVNDADVLQRDTVVEFTPGVNGSKRPNLFKTFTLTRGFSGIKFEEGKDDYAVNINDTGFAN